MAAFDGGASATKEGQVIKPHTRHDIGKKSPKYRSVASDGLGFDLKQVATELYAPPVYAKTAADVRQIRGTRATAPPASTAIDASWVSVSYYPDCRATSNNGGDLLSSGSR